LNLDKGLPLNLDPKKIKWSAGLKSHFNKGVQLKYDSSALRLVQYRPLQKMWLYNDKHLNDRPSAQSKLFAASRSNLCLVTGPDGVWISDLPIDLHLNGPGASLYPLLAPSESDSEDTLLFEDNSSNFAINQEAIEYFSEKLGKKISEEQLFYYCFGILSLPEYQSKFIDDLSKVKPRVPVDKNFFEISNLGFELAQIQLNYETLEPFKLQVLGETPHRRVQKIRLIQQNGKVEINVDNKIKISGIPN
jgi:predicted helicase